MFGVFGVFRVFTVEGASFLVWATLRISDSDEWLVRMLQTGTHPNFPEALKGVWWLHLGDHMNLKVGFTYRV